MNEFQGTIRFHRDYVAKANCSRWEFNIEGPDWIVSELCREMREYGLLHLNGPGGRMGSKTMGFMLGTGVGAGEDDARLMRHPLVRRLQAAQCKQPPALTREDVLGWPIKRLREECALRICGFRVALYHRENAISHYEDQGAEAYWRPDGSRWGMMTGFSPDIYWSHLGEVFKAMREKGWQRTVSILPSGPGETKIRVAFYPVFCTGVPAFTDGDAKDEPILTCQAALLADLGL